jgi:CRISPR-associated protein Csc3
MQELKAMAVYAAENRIKGGTNKRNALLKPLAIILDELDRCPAPDNPNELELIRAGAKEMIFDHLERIADAEYKPGRTKQEKISHYVDLFFDEVLKKAHRNNVNRLLARERLIRSAYLFYFREAMPQKAKGAAADAEANDSGDEGE